MPVSTQTTTAAVPLPLPLPPSRTNSISSSNSPRDSLTLKASTAATLTASSSTASLSSNAAAQPPSPSRQPSQPSASPAVGFASSAPTESSSTRPPPASIALDEAIGAPALGRVDANVSPEGSAADDAYSRVFVQPQYLPASTPVEERELATNASEDVSVSLHHPEPSISAGTLSGKSSARSPSITPRPLNLNNANAKTNANGHSGTISVDLRQSDAFADSPASSPSYSTTTFSSGSSSTESLGVSNGHVSGMNAGGAWFGVPQLILHAPKEDASLPSMAGDVASSSISMPESTSEKGAIAIASANPTAVTTTTSSSSASTSRASASPSNSNPNPNSTSHSSSAQNHPRSSHSPSSSRNIPRPLRLSHSNSATAHSSSHSASGSGSGGNALHQRAFQSDDLRTPITPAYNVASTYTVGAGVGVGAVPVGHSISEGSASTAILGRGHAHAHGLHDDGVQRATSSGTDTSDFLHPAYGGYSYGYNNPSSPTTHVYEYDHFLDSDPAYGEDGRLLPSSPSGKGRSSSSSSSGAPGLKRSSSNSSSGGVLRQALRGVGGLTVGIGMGAGRVGRLFVPRFVRRRFRPVLAFLGGGHARPLTAPGLTTPQTSLRISLSTANGNTHLANGSTTASALGGAKGKTTWERWAETPILWLLLYFGLNLSLTLYNKKVLISFPFPYSLTALHAACGSVGTMIMLRMDHNRAVRAAKASGGRPLTGSMASASAEGKPKNHLNGRELLTLFLFSILYTLNIVVSNASLRLVTVPFHQVVRASTPFFTIVFAAAILGKRCTRRKLLALIPVVVGVGFATYGDYYFTAFGFMLTLLGTVLAALKTILTNCILVKPGAKPTSSVSPGPSSPNAKHTLPVAAEIGHPLHQHVLRSSSRPTSPMSAKHEYFEVHETSSRDNVPSFPPSFFGSLAALIKEKTFASSSSTGPSSYENEKLFAAPPISPRSPHSPYAHAQYATYSQYSSNSGSTGPLGLPTLTLSPLHLLYLMSPLALVQTLLLAYFTGELARVHAHLFPPSLAALASASAPVPVIAGAAGLASPGAAIGIGAHSVHGIGAHAAMAGRAAMAMGMRAGHKVGAMGANGRFFLLLNGVLAFFLNVVSFNANRRVGPLGMSVAANVKQVLTVLCAVTMFNLTITPTNGIGIALTLLGGALYAGVELQEKRETREGKRRAG